MRAGTGGGFRAPQWEENQSLGFPNSQELLQQVTQLGEFLIKTRYVCMLPMGVVKTIYTYFWLSLVPFIFGVHKRRLEIRLRS